MASLRSKPTKQGFVIDVSITSLDLKTSIQTFNQSVREAKRVAADVTANERRIKAGEVTFDGSPYADMTPDEFRDEVLSFLRRGEQREFAPQTSCVTIAEGVAYFLKEHERKGTKLQTIAGYRGKLGSVETYLEREHGTLRFEQLTRPMLQKMAFTMCDEKSKKKVGEYTDHQTIKERLTRFRAVIRLLIVNGMTRLDHADLHRLFDDISLKPHASPYDALNNRDYQTLSERRETIEREGLSLDDPLCYQRVYLSDDEIRRFFVTAERQLTMPKFSGLRYRRCFVALLFAAYTGLRRSEITRLRRRDLDLTTRSFRAIKYKGRGSSRTHFEHHQTMPEPLVRHLVDWLPHVPEDQESVFASNDLHLVDGFFDDRQTRTKANELGHLLKRLMRRTEFEFCSGWHLHRHNFASLLVANGATPEEGAAVIGHKSTTMFQHYAHKSRQERDGVIDRLPSLG